MTDEHHDPVTHMDSHAVLSDDEHGRGGEALGPIDWAAWAYGVIGVAAGTLVVLCFWLALT